MPVHYVADLVRGFPRKDVTIHSAWSDRNGGANADGWRAIKDAGKATYQMAVVAILRGNKNPTDWRGIIDLMWAGEK